jgi:hypothetical protein
MVRTHAGGKRAGGDPARPSDPLVLAATLRYTQTNVKPGLRVVGERTVVANAVAPCSDGGVGLGFGFGPTLPVPFPWQAALPAPGAVSPLCGLCASCMQWFKALAGKLGVAAEGGGGAAAATEDEERGRLLGSGPMAPEAAATTASSGASAAGTASGSATSGIVGAKAATAARLALVSGVKSVWRLVYRAACWCRVTRPFRTHRWQGTLPCAFPLYPYCLLCAAHPRRSWWTVSWWARW